MADEKSTIDAALQELASLGRRIAELASTFESRRDSDALAPADEDEPSEPDRSSGAHDDDGADRTAAEGTGGGVGVLEQSLTVSRRRSRRSAAPRAKPAGSVTGETKPARLPPTGDVTKSKRRRRGTTSRIGRSAPRGRIGTLWPWHGRPAGPMLVSTALHVAALLALAMIFVARPSPPERMSIVSAPVEDVPLEDFADVEIESIEPVEPLDFEPLTDPAPDDAAPDDLVLLEAGPLAMEESAAAAESAPVDSRDILSGVSVGDLLAALGGEVAGGGNPGEGGGQAGGGGGGGGGMSSPATFFGKRGSGRSALFMCDNSASYVDGGFQAVLLELSRAVSLMKPDQSFHIVFFSDAAYPLLHPEGIDTFLQATPDNKRKLDAWLGTVELCIGGQGIRGAADLALALKPDVVYFLSDGDHAESVIDRMMSLPLDATVVHTFGMQADVRDRRTGLPDARKVADQQERNRKLARIAEAHGGTFTPVTISPQAALAASVRPIRKNRTRGTVWGTNLPARP